MNYSIYVSEDDYTEIKRMLSILGKIIFSVDQAKQEEALISRFNDIEIQEQRKIINQGDTLTAQKESQMLIDMPGISLNSKPRKDGRYQGYISNSDGTKQYFYARTREEVAIKMKLYLQEANSPKRKAQNKNSPTFGEYVEKWIEIYKKPNLKAKSLLSLSNSLKPAMQAFGNRKLASISGDDVQELLLSISAPRIRDLCRTYLNSVFKKAVVKNIIKRNPCEAVEIKRHKSKHKKALTIEEQETFFRATANSKYSLLYRFLTATGLRIGEALALHRSDIDFDNFTITVSKNVVFIRGERIEQDTPKSEAGNRTIPIPQNLCAEINKINTEILFPFTYNSVHCAIKRTASETKLPVSLHILRHTYATRLEEAGVPPKVKQYLLGHSSLEMTQNVYTDIQEKYIISISEVIRNIFKD